jgi:hypothetical protein
MTHMDSYYRFGFESTEYVTTTIRIMLKLLCTYGFQFCFWQLFKLITYFIDFNDIKIALRPFHTFLT